MKKTISLLMLLAMLLPMYTAAAEEALEIHVSVSGNDNSGKGTAAEPYQSFERAVNAVKDMQKQTNKKIDVVFHEGTYRFKNTVELNNTNSGSEKAPVVYRAAEGENVVFTNSQEIDITKIQLVQDMDILQKLPVEARGKVGMIDLKEQGVTQIAPYRYFSQYSADQSVAYTNVYLNGKEQPIAQWPNGRNIYSAYDMTINYGSSGERGVGGTIQLKDYRLSRWQTAENAVMDIWGGNDYAMDSNIGVASVDAPNKQVTFKTGTDQGLGTQKSKRFKIKNLIEELDMPGEWYIDREKLILYYYPEQSLDGAVMEITSDGGNLFRITDLKNVQFKDITFSKIKGSVFWGHNRWENITIDNCKFDNIGSYGIWQFSAAQSVIGVGTQASQYRENGCINIKITNSSFTNIGRNPISIRQSGGRDKLENGNTLVENCYFSNVNTVSGSGASIYVEGVRDTVRNNTIHNANYGINFLGIESEFYNNEIYNIQRYLSDAGGIYTGRNFMNRGNKIYHNYVRDVSNTDPHMNTNYNRHVYLDDADCGTSVYGNIFVGKASGSVAVNGGQDNHVYENVFVNTEKALLVNSWTMNAQERIDRYKAQAEAALKNPNYSKWYEIYQKGASDEYAGLPAFNEVYGNAVLNGEVEISAENLTNGTIYDNISVDLASFSDYENGDYRIVDKELLSKYPGLPNVSNFDCKEIGINSINSSFAKPDNFRLIYPQNGALGIQSKEIDFMWQLSDYADYYRFVLATDSEMKNIVEDRIVYENSVTVGCLKDDNTSYYWKVYAYNTSLNAPAEWESSGVPYKFITAKSFAVDKETLNIFAMEGERILSDIKEGSEPGSYVTGYSDMLKEKLSEINAVISGKKIDSADLERLITETQDLLENEIYVNGGYYNLKNAIKDPDAWIVGRHYDIWVSFDDDSIKISGDKDSEIVLGYNDMKFASRKLIMSFKLKADFANVGGSSNWFGFGMRGKPGEILYGNGNDQYFLVMKEGILEYQKNSGGTNKILETVQRDDIKSNEWMDIRFGVVDLHDIGVLTVLKINGKVAYQAIDTEINRIQNKGFLNFMVTKNVALEIAEPNEGDDEDINKLIEDYSLLMTEENCKAVQNEILSDSVIMKAESTKAYKNNSLIDIDNPLAVLNDMTMIPTETADVLLGAKTEINGKSMHVSYRGHIFEFTEGSKKYKIDGEDKELAVAAEAGYLPLRAVAQGGGMMVEYHNSGLICIMETSAMNTANYDWLLASTARSLALYNK